ncbi:MAG: hypothetical protein L3V56_03135 [Candidatus Magnetoovum sp. WYHC-5]|nr:hypothetical protein [Candidatus Magnetoovum sp. WYHC-5]
MLLNDVAVVIFGASLTYILGTSRLGAYVKILSVQGVLLFFSAISHAETLGFFHSVFIAFETLIVKATIIPLFIFFIIKDLGINREVEAYIDNFISVIVAILIVIGSFTVAAIMKNVGQDSNIDVLTMGVSISAVIIGLFIMISRKKLITHVMGYLVLENGIFLLSLALATDVPIIVEMGVLLDVFIGLFLMGIFINRIQSTFDSADISELTRLTD